MKSKPRYEDDSRPFQTKSHSLSPEEALRQVQLETVVDELRTLVFEYFLVRASFANNVLTKKAYWILASLLVFVERNNRFPKIKEQIQFLKIDFGLSGVPELPPMTSVDIIEREQVRSQMQVLKSRLLGLDRKRPNPSDLLSGKKT
jgi:hypothetical protein